MIKIFAKTASLGEQSLSSECDADHTMFQTVTVCLRTAMVCADAEGAGAGAGAGAGDSFTALGSLWQYAVRSPPCKMIRKSFFRIIYIMLNCIEQSLHGIYLPQALLIPAPALSPVLAIAQRHLAHWLAS